MTHFFKSFYKTRYALLLLHLAINFSNLLAQSKSVELSFNWKGDHVIQKLNNGFDGAIIEKSNEIFLPYYQTKIEGVVSVTDLKILVTDTFINNRLSHDWMPINQPKIESYISKENGFHLDIPFLYRGCHKIETFLL